MGRHPHEQKTAKSRRFRLAGLILFGLLLTGLLPAGAPVAEATSLGDLMRSARSGGAAAVGPAAVPERRRGTDRGRGTGEPTGDAVFESIELPADSLAGLPQWKRVVERMRADRAALERCFENAAACRSSAERTWRGILVEAAALPPERRLAVVNEFFNRWPYKTDSSLYGTSEYWATPQEFLTRSGDCEDYAIAKYFTLRFLGFAPENLRVVAVFDRIRNIAHAVLAVWTEEDILVLDNTTDLILSHRKFRHYRPQYSANETTRWAHVGGATETEKPVYRGLFTSQR